MSEYIIELRGISKKYGKKTVVDDVCFAVERGSIVGLIGPNGAGKTTILKLLAGLAKPEAGEMFFWGSEENLDMNRKRMSFMLEEPIVDLLMDAKDNLRYVGYVKGIENTEEKINEMLMQVGLGNTKRKKVEKFSLGMKQRLGIGMALLNDPEVLVLDEPMNGLDPEGVIEIRNMLKELSEKKHVTIIMSSHLLSELSEVCTDYVLIKGGSVVEVLSREELLEKSRKYITINTNDNDRTIELIKKHFSFSEYQIAENGNIRLYGFSNQIENLSKIVVMAGICILKLSYNEENLEQYYISKIGGIDGKTY